jgi:hypothetical protein
MFYHFYLLLLILLSEGQQLLLVEESVQRGVAVTLGSHESSDSERA